MNTLEIANTFVSRARSGDENWLLDNLYDDNCVSIEGDGVDPEMQRTEGWPPSVPSTRGGTRRTRSTPARSRDPTWVRALTNLLCALTST